MGILLPGRLFKCLKVIEELQKWLASFTTYVRQSEHYA